MLFPAYPKCLLYGKYKFLCKFNAVIDTTERKQRSDIILRIVILHGNTVKCHINLAVSRKEPFYDDEERNSMFFDGRVFV